MTIHIRRSFGRAHSVSPWDSREPLREELFSLERLEQHARSLAVAQSVTARAKPTKGRPLARRLADNGAVLLDAYRKVARGIDEGRAITPPGEWLLDNYHLVERQIRAIHADLPPGYYRQLPKLAGGPFVGYPRVFGVAWAFVAHTDSRFDADILCRFVRAYQNVQPLTIGELWAVAITLRIVLIENLRRLGRTHRAQRRRPPGSGRAGRSFAGWRRTRRRADARRCSPVSNMRGSAGRTPSRFSSCTGCATRIRASRRR